MFCIFVKFSHLHCQNCGALSLIFQPRPNEKNHQRTRKEYLYLGCWLLSNFIVFCRNWCHPHHQCAGLLAEYPILWSRANPRLLTRPGLISGRCSSAVGEVCKIYNQGILGSVSQVECVVYFEILLIKLGKVSSDRPSRNWSNSYGCWAVVPEFQLWPRNVWPKPLSHLWRPIWWKFT